MLIYLDLSGYKSLRCCNNFRASRPKEVSYHVLGRKLDTKLYRKQKIIITRGSFQQPTKSNYFHTQARLFFRIPGRDSSKDSSNNKKIISLNP